VVSEMPIFVEGNRPLRVPKMSFANKKGLREPS
jgi:hypothetical protein